MEALTGHPPCAFIKSPLLWESLIHPSDLSAISAWGKLPPANRLAVNRVYRVQNHLTHEWTEIEDRAETLDGADGKPATICGVLLRREPTPALVPAAETTFNELIESVEGIVWEVDPKTLRYTYVSKQAERLLGYPLRRWMEEPTFWQDHLHPEDAARATEECLGQTREMRNHELEYRMIAADGRIVWLRDYVTVVVANQAPVLLRGIMVDISPAKEAEESFQTLNEALVDAGRIAKIGMWELDLDQPDKVWWSDQTYEIHEIGSRRAISVDEAIGFYVPEHQERIRLAVAEAIERDQPWDLTLQIITAKGRRIWVRAIGHSIRNADKVVKVRGIFQDIDVTRTADERLRESEQRWQFALEGSGDGVWDWDIETDSVFFSKQLRSMLGYEDEALGSHFEDLLCRIHRDDRALTQARLDDHLRQKSQVYSSEHRMRCKDGSYKWILDRGMVLSRTAEGKPSRMIGTLTDLTARKALDERVRQSQKMDAIG